MRLELNAVIAPHQAAPEFCSDGIGVQNILTSNETIYVDVTLRRIVDKNIFRFDRADQPSGSFKRVTPSGWETDGLLAPPLEQVGAGVAVRG